MYALATDHILNYRITEYSGGVRLTMWETSCASDDRRKPYLYRVHCFVENIEAARSALRKHLALNGASGVTSLEIPSEGKVRIMPYPTWGDCEAIPQEVLS